MLQRKYMEKYRCIARTVSIEAVLQPRFHYAMNYFSFKAEVLFAGKIRSNFHQNLANVRQYVLSSNILMNISCLYGAFLPTRANAPLPKKIWQNFGKFLTKSLRLETCRPEWIVQILASALHNEYLVAKIVFDTAENEPCKVCPLSAYRSLRFDDRSDGFFHLFVSLSNCSFKSGSIAEFAS